MKFNNQHKTFLLGLSVSVLILVSFFAGAIADRLFVIQPLDVITGKIRLPAVRNQLSNADNSQLGTIMAEQASVADITEIAAESVVTVSIRQEQQVIERFDPFGIFGLPSTRTEQVQRDIGTGFVVGEENLVVTNKHVVGDAESDYSVIDREGNEYQVTQIYRDPSNDLAIIRAEGLNVSSLPLGDSDQLRVGEEVIAIGTALGEFRHTVTTGVISGLGRGIEAINPSGNQSENLEDLIQTDAAINPGNSGGPLLDRSGKVIGVNVAVSAGAENVGFALPINLVKASIDNFTATGSFDRPFLGVSYQNISAQAALTNEVPQGAYLLRIVERSTAAEAGLREGDIITRIDGESLREADLAEIINRKSINQRVRIDYWREGENFSVDVTLRSQ